MKNGHNLEPQLGKHYDLLQLYGKYQIYGNHKKSPLFTLSHVRQGLFQQFIACDACDNRTQPPAHFQTIFKFRTFLPKFSNILPFFALFRNNHTHALTFQNRPCQSAQFTMLETFQGFPFSSVIITCTIFFYNLFYQRFYILCSTIVARGILADIKKII